MDFVRACGHGLGIGLVLLSCCRTEDAEGHGDEGRDRSCTGSAVCVTRFFVPSGSNPNPSIPLVFRYRLNLGGERVQSL